MQSSDRLSYNVDLVLCIDATGSMIPHIDRTKNNALKFHSDIYNTCQSKGKIIDNFRVRIIVFRDLYEDSEALYSSPFYTLPAQIKDYESFVKRIEAKGGGVIPETGLEALAEAIKSDWQKTGDRRRQVIALFTDAPSHPLEKSGKKSNYPKGMPKNLDELTDMWDGQASLMHPTYKRLVLFAPDEYAWSQISEFWSLVVHHPAQAGKGLDNNDYNAILTAIANSI